MSTPAPTMDALLAAFKMGGREALAALGIRIPSIDRLSELVFCALGQASVCWDNAALSGAGVFHSDECKRVGDELLLALLEEIIAAQLP